MRAAADELVALLDEQAQRPDPHRHLKRRQLRGIEEASRIQLRRRQSGRQRNKQDDVNEVGERVRDVPRAWRASQNGKRAPDEPPMGFEVEREPPQLGPERPVDSIAPLNNRGVDRKVEPLKLASRLERRVVEHSVR